MLLLNLTRMRALTPTLPAYAAAFTRPTPTGDQDVLNAWLNDHTNQVPIFPRALECRLHTLACRLHTHTPPVPIPHTASRCIACRASSIDATTVSTTMSLTSCAPHPLIYRSTLSSAAGIPSYRRCRTPPPTLGDSNSTPKLPPHPTTTHPHARRRYSSHCLSPTWTEPGVLHGNGRAFDNDEIEGASAGTNRSDPFSPRRVMQLATTFYRLKPQPERKAPNQANYYERRTKTNKQLPLFLT